MNQIIIVFLLTTPISLAMIQMQMRNKIEKQTVAIIGGGIAGLSCAQALCASDRYLPTVFDTGRLRPGGRCSSRLPSDSQQESQEYNYLDKTIIDHAAQILTIPKGFPAFEKQVKTWEERGVIKRFKSGTVCNIGNPYDKELKKYDKTKISLRKLDGDMYYGINGMQSLPLSMMGDFEVKQDVWVSPSNGVKLINSDGGQQWQIKASGEVLGKYDKLVIAHNGKCADRLMSSTPAKDLHRLLQVNFAPYVAKNGGKRMTLNSIYSLTFAIQSEESPLSKALPEKAFTSGFVKNHPNLKFISCNTRKYGSKENEDFEVWTVLSSAKFGKAFKGPQENLPKNLVQNVTAKMYESLEQALALPKGSLRGQEGTSSGSDKILESRLQLWGAAVPLNTWITENEENQGFLYDGEYGVGACGDWLVDSSITGAWESGRRLAKYMCDSDEPESTGLRGAFQISTAVDKAGIGSLQ